MKEKVYEHPEGFLSKEKENDLKIYKSLKEITCKYGSPFYLKQSMHLFDTQINEALNQSQAALTPKNKVFHIHPNHSIIVMQLWWELITLDIAIFGRPHSTK